MKLLYLYIKNYGCIKDQEFNFDSNYRFHLERKNQEKWELIEDTTEDPLPEDFWTISKDRKVVVESVSAIVGSNGSGKTTLARFLGSSKIFIKYIIIYIKYKGKEPQYITNIENLITKIKKSTNFSDNYLPFIYFSPFFTTEHIGFNQCVDISTSSLLSTKGGMSLQQQIWKYISDEYKRAIDFLYEYYKINVKYYNPKKGHVIPMTFPEPQGIQIAVNHYMDLFEFTNNLIIDNNVWSKINRKIYAFKRKNTNNEVFRLLNIILDKGEDKFDNKQIATFLTELIKDVHDDFVLLTFLYYVIAYVKQHIKPGGMTVQKIRHVSEFHMPVKKTDPEIVVEYIFIVLEFINDNFSDKSYKKLLETIKNHDPSAFDFFNSLINIQKNTFVKGGAGYIVVPVYYLSEIKNQFLDLVYKYNNLGLNDSFLLFDFDPKMSSGEMSFLTIFSRIYDSISNNKQIIDNDEIILFLDEAETTLHPKWQRRLVLWMITFFEVFAKNKKVHIIFGTHSSILLSDIPDSNVIFLEKDSKTENTITVKQQDIDKTFGANIHTLLAKSFFLDKTIGEFASRYIEEICEEIKKINNISMLPPKGLSMINQKINRIAEEFIRIGLQHYLLDKIKALKTPDNKSELKDALLNYIDELEEKK